MSRNASVTRKTKETDITATLELDGTGNSNIDTGIGFFDHMLEGFSRHGFFDLILEVEGDLQVDGHHTVEDTGIVIGSVIKKALGDKAGIRRYGSCILPMDTELVREFFYAISYSVGMNLHIKLLDGSNNHHIIEAMFKAFAKALDMAVEKDPRIQDVLSTKGSL